MSMFGNGNGYHGWSMSNNAIAAYEEGERPLSKWTKADILDRVTEVIEEYGIEIKFDQEKLKALRAPDLKDLLLHRSSWHHTGKMFNRTDFYDVDAEILEELTDEQIEAAKSSHVKKEEPEEEKWECEFLEWGGTRKHPKAVKHTEIGTVKGNWFFRADGSKKKTDANGFRFIRRV